MGPGSRRETPTVTGVRWPERPGPAAMRSPSRGGARETFTVRKISYGVGVERTFPVHSPSIDKIEVVSRGRVRRAKLYYLRSLRGKAARIRERRETPTQ